jgi:hypothetical protein
LWRLPPVEHSVVTNHPDFFPVTDLLDISREFGGRQPSAALVSFQESNSNILPAV